MCRAACVVVLVASYLGSAHSWDFAVSLKYQLVFFTNGAKTNTVHLMSQNPTSLVYDEVHDMILYIDKQNNNDTICGYNLSSKDNKCFIKRNGRNIHGLAFEPVTEKIFFSDTNERSINFISLKPGYNNNVDENIFIKVDDNTVTNIAVDSCRGYIYWFTPITNIAAGQLVRAQINGSTREVILTRHYYETFNLAIDLQTRKIFYFDDCKEELWAPDGNLNSNDLRGNNEVSLLDFTNTFRSLSKVLTVSKDYIYFVNSSESYDTVWQLPKHARGDLKPKEISKFYNERTLGITANYKIADQIKDIQGCDSLLSVIPVTTEAPLLTGERCNVSACENYCLQGNCSFNDEGLPICSCNAGYSGDRCDVNSCHGYCLNNGECSLNEENAPVCQCKGDYVGDRCEVTDCLYYCIQGSCSFNDEGRPKCSCNAGFSGDRCEVDACHGYCLNNGECSLNEEDEPMCECVGNHKGSRCEADINDTIPTYDSAKRNLTLANLLSILRKPSSKMYLTVEV